MLSIEPGRAAPGRFTARIWRHKSVLALIAANLLPLEGLAAGSLTAGNLIFLFWFEGIIAGFFNIAKFVAWGALRERPPDLPLQPWQFRALMMIAMLFLSAVFAVHFGLFCVVPGNFVMGLSGISKGHTPLDLPWMTIGGLRGNVGYAAGALALSHGISFVWDFLVAREYKQVEITDMMGAPYVRIVPLYLALLPGIILYVLLESRVVFLLIVIAAKIVVDVRLHLWEREGGLARLRQRRKVRPV